MAQVFPTKSNLIATRKSLDLALMGYDLLDRKRNILVREIMQLAEQAKGLRQEIDAAYRKAYLDLQRANVTLGFSYEFAQAVPIDDTVRIDFRSVMGVEIPRVTNSDEVPEIYYGMNATNSLLDEAYLSFLEVKKKTLQLAEVETSVFRLADAVKKTQKRTNAMNNVMIPRFRKTVKFISDALDEKEREEYSRLKVIKRQGKG